MVLIQAALDIPERLKMPLMNMVQNLPESDKAALLQSARTAGVGGLTALLGGALAGPAGMLFGGGAGLALGSQGGNLSSYMPSGNPFL